MYNARGYGIKIIVSFHSYNALKDKRDFYGQYYGTGDFYSSSEAIGHYKDRIAHVMAHVNPHNGKTWANSPEYIFAFETQNEAMHGNVSRHRKKALNGVPTKEADATDSNTPTDKNPQESPDTLAKWQCTIATAIKSNLQSRTDILVSTGGASYLATSAPDAYLSCAALDIIAIHAYGVGDLTKDALIPYVQKAQKAGKKLIMQEWGMCYYNTANNNCDKGTPLSTATRDANIKKYADSISQAGIPWMYWQIIPNADPHDGYDYEVRSVLCAFD